MPRPDRIFVEGGIYHVYNRLGHGERVFDEEVEASVFVSLLRKIAVHNASHLVPLRSVHLD